MAGKIKKLLENELVGGTQSNDVYPVTSIKAVYDEENERLDNIINRRGVVNISTNYNSDHIVEVLTLEQAIDKVPSKDRVLGFSGTFLTSKGWVSYQFNGDSVAEWTDSEKWNLQANYIIASEFGSDSNLVVSQSNVSEVLSNKGGFWYKGLVRDTDIRLLECIVDYTITYTSKKLPKSSFKLLQTGFSTSSGYENKFLFYAVREDGEIYNFTANLIDKVGIKEYSNTIGGYTATIIFNWDIYNKYFENRYSAPNNEATGDGIHFTSQYGLKHDYEAFKDDYALSYLFNRNSYIGDNERKFISCISEFSVSTPNGGDIFKVLQMGRSVTNKGQTVFNLRNVSTNSVYYFGISETDYTGVKSYNTVYNKARFRITINWDTLLSYFDNYYSPNVETITDGLFISSTNNSFDDIQDVNNTLNELLNESNSINQFNGDNQIEDNERLILQCLRMYKVITLDKPYEFKLLQTGFSTSESRAIFYMGIRNADNSLTVVNAVPQEGASSLDELKGVKRYETEIYSSACGKIKQIVVIDWNKYKELLTNRYSPASTGSFSGRRLSIISDVENNVSNFADKETVENIGDSLSICVRDINDVDVVAFEPTGHTEYFRNGYVVYNVPFDRSGLLKSITTNIFKHGYTVMQFTLLIGKIDQRNWLINPRTYSYSFSELGIPENYSNKNLTIDLLDKNIKVNEGEVLCLFSRRNSDSSDGKSFLIERNNNNSDKVLFSTSLEGEFTANKEFANLSYSVKCYDTDFADKETVSDIKNDVTALTETINLSSIFVDLSTGKRYKIVVNNGGIQLKNIDYSKILFIGSSFVNHGISSDVGWYRNGAMAPSIGAHSLPNLVLKGVKSRNSKCTLNIMNSVDWERNYNTTFDFDTSWKSTLQSVNPDVIFMHISGNSTWTKEFESACEEMIANVKKTCPLADIYIAASWYGGQKATDMRTACNNKGAVYVDLSSCKITSSMWRAGDWYYAEDDSQYHGIFSTVASHPNDIGCMLQANAYLRSAGYNEILSYHSIEINSPSNIVATTPNNIWLENGIVTVRIESGNVNSFTVTKKSGGVVVSSSRTNNLNTGYSTYYTFTMPNEDVTINIT